MLFGQLWLSEDLPAVLGGIPPQSLMEVALPTNPVHILDLAFFLPAVTISGVMLLKRVPLGFIVAPAFLVFLVLAWVLSTIRTAE